MSYRNNKRYSTWFAVPCQKCSFRLFVALFPNRDTRWFCSQLFFQITTKCCELNTTILFHVIHLWLSQQQCWLILLYLTAGSYIHSLLNWQNFCQMPQEHGYFRHCMVTLDKALRFDTTSSQIFCPVFSSQLFYAWLFQCKTDILVLADNHVMLVQRQLGSKVGTGGTSGYQYLRSTVR